MDESCEVGREVRCSLLALLRLDHPDCGRCKALQKRGIQMRERLDELNVGMQQDLLHNSDRGEVVEIFDSERGKIVARQTISLPKQGKKAG